MNKRVNGDTGYHEVREAERLMGHYLLLLAILGKEDDAHLELARLRVAQRRQQRVLCPVEVAVG
jgi:hypothetical protein